MPAVVCRDLAKHYGAVTALDGLNLTVDDGVIFGFLGPNGAGKTTTLKILTGLGRASSGRAWVAGEEVLPGSISLHSKIGYLPEEPAFYTWMNAKEYLTFVGRLFRISEPEIRKRSEELLALVDLAEAASRRIGGYSRGMRQRLGIAQALMNRPAVLFLDEPSSALDPLGRAEVLQTLSRLKLEATTVFLSSHVLGDVERVCDIVGIIDKGRLVVESGVAELRERFGRTTFELEFEEDASSLAGKFDHVPWVEGVEFSPASPDKVVIYARNISEAKHELPRLVVESGLTLLRYELELPSLEQVFIELVGRKED